MCDCDKVERLEADNKKLASEVEKLKDQIETLKKFAFGPKSEKFISDPSEQGTFEELLAEVDSQSSGESSREEVVVASHKKKKSNKRSGLEDLIPDCLPEEYVYISLPEEKLICPKTGLKLVKIGEEKTVKLAHKAASYYKKVFIREKYAVKGNALSGVITAPAPDFAIPGGYYDESFIAKIIYERVALHLPFYRIEEDLKTLGIKTSRQTLNKLYMQAADVLKPIYQLMKSEILRSGIIFTDDTPVKLQTPGAGKLKTGRMWVYLTQVKHKYILFDFTIDRSKSRTKEFIGDFKGYIHADAYRGYDDLFKNEDIIECACWMHIRRKFYEAEDAPPKLRNKVLTLIQRLYKYEKRIKKAPPDFRLKIRQKYIKKIIDDIKIITADALKEQIVLPNSKFGGATSYLHNLGDAVYTFTRDERLSPDNGPSERAIKPLAIGRKNWLFAGSKKGGDATGILMSLIQTCRQNNINARDYIEDLLRRINGHPYSRLHELLPNSNWKPLENYY